MLALPALAALAAAPQCTTPECIFQLDLSDPGTAWADLIPAPDFDGDGLLDFSLVDYQRIRTFSSAHRQQLASVTSSFFGSRSRWIGDANGDGTEDILARASDFTRLVVVDGLTGDLIYTLNPVNTPSVAGTTVHYGRLPDVDGDGVDDFWVRSRISSTTSNHTADVYSTVTGALLRRLSGPNGPSRFGVSVAVLDDMDGDGVPEIAVGDDSIGSNPTVRGRVYVVSPVTGATLQTIEGDATGNDIDEYVQTIGDMDRDGYRDILVRRRASLHFVETYSSSTGEKLAVAVDPLPRGGLSSSWYGQSTADVGDVDGDQVPDFVVASMTAQQDSTLGGAVFLFSGANGRELWRSFVDDPTRAYARHVFGLGDTDGDGKDEWAVTSPHGTPGPTTPTQIFGYRFIDDRNVIGFEVAGDQVTPLENGRALDLPGLLEPAIRVSGLGAGQHGPAAFDSSPSGPNASSNWPGLLVDSGNLVVLQGDPLQSTPGIFDSPGPASGSGEIYLEFLHRTSPISIDLVGLGATTSAEVSVRDASGLAQTYTVPPGFTSDALADPSRATWTLYLDTEEDQRGAHATATAVRQPGFNETSIAALEVRLDGPGAIDRLVWTEAGPPSPGAGVVVDRVPSPGGPVLQVTGLGDLDGDGQSEFAIANRGIHPVTESVTIHDGMTGAPQLEIPAVRGETLSLVAASVGGANPQLFIGNHLWRPSQGAPTRGLFYTYDPVTGQRTGRVEGPMDGVSFAEQVCAMGDLNGDGVDEYAVSAWAYVQYEGRVYIYSGADHSLLHTLSGAAPGEHFGYDIECVGDVNGDGLDDLAVLFVDPAVTTGSPWALRIVSAVDGTTLAERRPSTSTSTVSLYNTLGLLSDVDGDGVQDLLVSSVGVVTPELAVVSGATCLDIRQLQAPATPGFFGSGVRAPGDIDGDGRRDIAWSFNSGGGSTIRGISGATFEPLFDLEGFVQLPGLVGLGDANGDGVSDLGAFVGDEVVRVAYRGSTVSTVCSGQPTSQGLGSRLRVSGGTSVAAGSLELTAWNLPATSFLLLMNAQASIPAFGPGAVPIVSDGRLCLSPASLARHPVLFNVTSSSRVMDVDLSALPTAGVPGFVAPATVGETRFFQCWFRDTGGSIGSNLTDAIAITFEN